MDSNYSLESVLHGTLNIIDHVVAEHKIELKVQEVGTVSYIGQGIARVRGLKGVRSEELISFPGDVLGLASNIESSEVGVILLGGSQDIEAGSEAYRTGRVLDIPVGRALVGRVIDATGRPLDDRGEIRTSLRLPVEKQAPAILDRAPVTVPLQTGLKAIDALIPIGRGQRELILGDRQTGKTAIAVDTILNQRDKEVICIYCAIGQRSSSVAKVIADLRKYNALDYCIIIVASGEDPPGLQFVAPYSATTIAEYFMEQGLDTLVVFDDLTRHARAYRELSLLLRRPPGREAFPGDIFYIHSRLLERSTHLRPELGGGSLTALPIIETEAQNISAYIPTNLISITDGQIYLSPDLFQKGILPAIDIGKSVSRVGGKTQLDAYRSVVGDLRLYYSQFEELEAFARFSTKLDAETRKTIERGRRVREVLKQRQYEPMSVPEQIAILSTVSKGLLDDLPLEKIADIGKIIRKATIESLPKLCRKIESGEKLSEDDRQAILTVSKRAIS